jgi:hypothetical protein
VREVTDLVLPKSLLSKREEDATNLRREVTSSILPLTLPSPTKPVVPFALALALDELAREITLNDLR